MQYLKVYQEFIRKTLVSATDGVLLCSGGMDSTVLAHLLVSLNVQCHCVLLNYGQHCFQRELERAQALLPKSAARELDVIDISDIYKWSNSRLVQETDLWKESIQDDDLYIPYRNSLFLTIGAAIAESKGLGTVYSAFINSNHAKEVDCSLKFFEDVTPFLASYGAIRICVPFKEISKSDVARIGCSLGVPIERTFSCQVNSTFHCGSCPNCIDRIKALEDLEL